MVAGVLAAAMALGAAEPSSRPTLAVVVVSREGMSFAEAAAHATRLAKALTAAGAAVPADPRASVLKLGSQDPEACKRASRCLADVAKTLGVSGLVTLEGGRVLDEIALVVSLLDGRDGRKLLERSKSLTASELDAAMAGFADEVAKAAAALITPVADVPLAARPLPPRPDLEAPKPANVPHEAAPAVVTLNTSDSTVVMTTAAAAAGAVTAYFWGTAAYMMAGAIDPQRHGMPCPPGVSGSCSQYTPTEWAPIRDQIDLRLNVARISGAAFALLGAGALFILFQPPDAQGPVQQPGAW